MSDPSFVLSPDWDPSTTLSKEDIIHRSTAISTASALTNLALSYSRGRNHTKFASLHEESLKIKLQIFGEHSIQAGLSYNALGEEYLSLGRLEDAEKVLKKALTARDVVGDDRLDVAVSRDNLAAVKEAQGDWKEARTLRAKGGENGWREMVCSWGECQGGLKMLKEFKACSACTSVFYCSNTCQKRDWKGRHKVLCIARSAALKTEASASG